MYILVLWNSEETKIKIINFLSVILIAYVEISSHTLFSIAGPMIFYCYYGNFDNNSRFLIRT